MPLVIQRRLLARAPNFNKTEAGVKALVSVFFLFSSSLPNFVGGALAPKPLLRRGSTSVRLPLLSCLAQSLPLAPAVNLTCARARLWFKLTVGPLLRGIQAVLQELAGSATGGADAGCRSSAGRRAPRVVTHPPPDCISNSTGRPAQIQNFSFASRVAHQLCRTRRTAKEDMATRQLLDQAVEQLPCNNI